MLLLKALGKNVRKKSMICSNKINPDRFKICRGYLCLLQSNYAFLDRRGRRSLQGKIKLPYENHAFGLLFFLKLTSLFNTTRGRKLKWCIFEPHFVLFNEPFLMFEINLII